MGGTLPLPSAPLRSSAHLLCYACLALCTDHSGHLAPTTTTTTQTEPSPSIPLLIHTGDAAATWVAGFLAQRPFAVATEDTVHMACTDHRGALCGAILTLFVFIEVVDLEDAFWDTLI